MNDKDKPAANKNTNDNADLKKSTTEEKPVSPIKSADDTSSKPTLSSRILLILLIFIAGMALAVYLIPTLKERLPFIANWIGSEETNEMASLGQRIDAQQAEIIALQQKTVALENILNDIPADSGELITSDLEDRISALEAIANGAAAVQAPPSQPIADTTQSARIDMLLSRMSQLEASFVPLSKNMFDAEQAQQDRTRLARETTTLNEKLAEVENRLSTVEQVAAKDNSGILLNLKIADLKRSFDRGSPYSAEISAIEQIIKNGSLSENTAALNALATLKQHSNNGITTIDQSARGFNALIPNMLKEEGKDPDATWLHNTLSSIKNLITVRQTDSTALSASDLDKLITQIDGYLSRQNPHAAAATADTLPDRIKTVLASWRADLQFLIEGNDAIAALESLATESYLNKGLISAAASEVSL